MTSRDDRELGAEIVDTCQRTRPDGCSASKQRIAPRSERSRGGTCPRLAVGLWSAHMAGAIAVVVVLLLIPVLVLMSGGVFAAVFGQALEADAEQRDEGSELLELDD